MQRLTTNMKKLLIVDDDEAVLLLLQFTLAGGERRTVLTARTGEDALEIARRERPDVILLDVVMPGMNGYQVCRELKADPNTAHAIVIMLTALAQRSHRQLGEEAGADLFMTKPYSPRQLLETIDRYLGEV
ncbi:MAG: response regulator [Chloroflexi bacterium]|nr:response regulator [Chloroflexota bacterium]